jgi:NAD(P)-dependent dehydrogenase (short-subunit alcohol dehydrogenase family)
MSYSSNAPLKDRVAIVTGASGGIGRETSKALRESGATVVMSDRNSERGQKVAHELGLEFFPPDVTRSEEIQKLAHHVQSRFGRIDIAFNKAGIARLELYSTGALPRQETSKRGAAGSRPW